MRIKLFSFFFFCSCLAFGSESKEAFCYTQSCVDFNLINRKVSFTDFNFGGHEIKGDFLFTLKNDNGSLMFNLEGENVIFDGENIPYVKLALTQTGQVIHINQFSLPQCTVEGTVDLSKEEVDLDIVGRWQGGVEDLEGQMELKAKVWGKIDDCFATGYLVIKDGKYKENDFSKISLCFLGKPPLLNITDSEIIFKSGRIFEIGGVLDLRDFSNFTPDAAFIEQKFILGKWQLYSENRKRAGLKKDINNKFAFFFNAEEQKGENIEAGTELRYNLQKDNFLKLIMRKNETALGFEKRNSF